MQMISKTTIAILGLSLLGACAGTSQTESEFGNSVRSVVASQQLNQGGPLADDEPLNSTDGRRAANVTTTYQQHVGDPKMVVGDAQVKQGSK